MTAQQILSRLDGVRQHNDNTFMARCPAHADRLPSLSIKELPDRVLLNCFGGCTVESVVGAIALTVNDLFATKRDHDALRDTRIAFRVDPHATAKRMLEFELLRIDEEREREYGYVPPRRSLEHNRARRRVSRIVGVDLPPKRAYLWEEMPHDTDPAWPTLFYRRYKLLLADRFVTAPMCLYLLSAFRFRACELAAIDLWELTHDRT